MSEAIRIDGKGVAARLKEEIRLQLEVMRGTVPRLTVVIVGEDPASQVYVKNKAKACEAVGMDSDIIRLAEDCSEQQLKQTVLRLNDDPQVHGLLVQLPLPDHLDPVRVRGWLNPLKDVDGLHPENVGLLASGIPRFVPCTPAGCMVLLNEYSIPLSGQRAVVIGRSLIVGRPMAALLSTKGVDATVTMAHSRSADLPRICAQADILIVAAGIPHLVTRQYVKEGAAVIDVGMHRLEDPSRKSGYRLAGDVDPAVGEIASYLTPVPGGVGPMTIAMLLKNTVQAFEIASKIDRRD